MKNYSKLVLFIATTLLSIAIFSQVTKSNYNNKVNVIVSDKSGESKKKTLKINSEFKEKYLLKRLNDNYFWFRDKNKNNNYYNVRKYGIIKKTGEVILPCLFDEKCTFEKQGNNDKLVVLSVDKEIYGVFNLEEKKWSIPLVYEKIKKASKKFYEVQKNDTYQCIYIGENGITTYDWLSLKESYSLKNYAIVTVLKNNKFKYGVFSLLERKMVIPCVYNELKETSNNFIVQHDENYKYNIIGINNKPIYKTWYDFLKEKSETRYLVKKNNFTGVVDDKGNTVIPLEYLSIAEEAYSNSSYLAQNKNGKYGLITIDGVVTLPFVYDDLIKNIHGNLTAIRDNKYGKVAIDSKTPKEVIACKYDAIDEVKNLFIVKQNNKFGLLDKHYKTLAKPIYDTIEILNYNAPILIKATIKGKSVILKTEGKITSSEKYNDFNIIENQIKPKSYHECQNCYLNYSYLKAKKNNKYEVLNKELKKITNQKFEDVISESNDILIVKSNNKYGLFSIVKNKMIVDYDYSLITNVENYFIGVNGNKIDVLKYNKGEIEISKK